MRLSSIGRPPVLAVMLFLAAACMREEAARPDCLIDAGPCSRAVGTMEVTLDVSPRPVRAMRDLQFTVRLRRDGLPVEKAGVEVDLTMPGMRMGENRVLLRHGGEGRYQGRGVIVRCPSGQKLWKVSVLVNEREQTLAADFLFEAP